MSGYKDRISHDVYLRFLHEEKRLATESIERFTNAKKRYDIDIQRLSLRLEKIENEITNVESLEQMLDDPLA